MQSNRALLLLALTTFCAFGHMMAITKKSAAGLAAVGTLTIGATAVAVTMVAGTALALTAVAAAATPVIMFLNFISEGMKHEHGQRARHSIVSRAEVAYDNALQFNDAVMFYEQNSEGRKYTDVFEPFLYRLATDEQISKNGRLLYIVSTASQLKEILDELSFYSNELQVQFISLKSDQLEKLYRLKGLFKDIHAFLPRISSFSDFCHYHKNYFACYYKELELMKDYRRQLQAIAHDDKDLNSIANDLCATIVDSDSVSGYPLVSFIKMCEKDIVKFKKYSDDLGSNYPERKAAAQMLYDRLVMIKEIIVSLDAYSVDLLNAKEAELRYLAMEEARKQEYLRQDQLKESQEKEKQAKLRALYTP